jgi:hypothetical protein
VSQARTDEAVVASARRRTCPATGLSVWESLEAEQKLLTPLPEFLPEPFDRVAERPVSRDALVSFEGRSYNVPFGFRPDACPLLCTESQASPSWRNDHTTASKHACESTR